MEYLVNEDAVAFGRAAAKRYVQHQTALPGVTRGMDRLPWSWPGLQTVTARPQTRAPLHRDGVPAAQAKRSGQLPQRLPGAGKKVSSL